MSAARYVTDAVTLFWPIRGGYRLFLPYAFDRAWPLLRALAWTHRRLLVPHVRMVAVVGSVGKTTTKRMVDAALGEGVTRHSVSNYGFGLADNLLRGRPWHRHAVLEVGIAGPGRMASYARMIRPDLVVVTSVKSDHNRSLPTLEATRAEKVRMVQALPPHGLAVLNGDDPHVDWMATQTRARVVRFGLGPHNDIRASDVALEWPHGTRATLHAAGQVRPMRLQVLGAHQVRAALAAVAVALAEGIDLEAAISRLARVEPTPRRLQPIVLDNGAVVLSDEFKGSLESFHAALDTFADVPAKRRIVVLGDVHEPQGQVGDLYRELGRRVARLADRLVLVGGNRLDTLKAEAVRSGMPRASTVYVGMNVLDAIDALKGQVSEGDVILLKGSSSQRLERVTLALQGKTVRCQARQCRVRSCSCSACPLREQPERALENVYIRRLVVLPNLGTPQAAAT
jgi:UDP-N-acetylmuramoyl-tripeptide--D-alanyl-D-alanine ligase